MGFAAEAYPRRQMASLTPEEHRKLRLKVMEAQRLTEAKVEDRMAALTLLDRKAVAELTRFFNEAVWMSRMEQFPDGRPLNEQHRWAVEMWNLMLLAIDCRQNGAETFPVQEKEDG